MVLKKSLMACTLASALTGGTGLPVAAAPWTRGYVVSAYEYAFRYGGRPGFTRKGEDNPGVDCPHGVTNTNSYTNPEQIKRTLARQKWRSQQEIEWIANPPGLDQIEGGPEAAQGISFRALSYRGYKKGIETYVNPWAAEDPGQPQVTSRIAEGFNLDGKVGPHDFVGPDGEKGIDNALYRAWGCGRFSRGNYSSLSATQTMDSIRTGLFTIVLRISGNQDPMNDSDATLEIGYSPDKAVKDARGDIAIDYSYRILKSALYTKLKARIKNGAVETEQVDHLHMPCLATNARPVWEDSNFSKGKIRLNIAPDGLSATALIGGYRNWRDVYAESIAFQGGAGAADASYHEDHVAMYYALRRNVDGMYNAKSRSYDGISTAYRMRMASAYVVDAEKPMDVPMVLGHMTWRKPGFDALKVNIIKGIETRIPQDVPPGTGEAHYPRLEKDLEGLPSKDFFLKVLDRPHFPDGVGIDGDEGYPIDDQGNRIEKRGN
ncbi:hypothetical protein ABIA85_008241 [Bradyrhizobium sp. LA6.10]|uniref:hypothetical protein n=1 Tax=Bradyrhizobium sp. LA6.10 TaxID=3156318 RepID=UPI0033966D56